jgi:hypothetical protein
LPEVQHCPRRAQRVAAASALIRNFPTRLLVGDAEAVLYRFARPSTKGQSEFVVDFARSIALQEVVPDGDVLPSGFHCIRHYCFFANGNRANNIALARRLLGVPDTAP